MLGAGQAYADAHRHRVGVIGKRCQRFHTGPNALGQQPRPGQVGFRQYYLKLLPPITSGQICRTADARLDGFGHLPQRVVTTGMAVSLVKRLEVVHIHHQHGQWLAIALRTRPLLAQHLVQTTAVGQAGQAVGGG
ncbi:hypothetical protein D3C81_1911370 [compost metagenome]